VLVLAGLRCPLRIQIDIVCNKQVEVAVTVVVYKTATGVPPSRWTVLLKAGLWRNIGERPVSVVVVKDDSTPISHDQIVISIVVVIEKGNTTSRFLQEPALVGATAENIDCSA